MTTKEYITGIREKTIQARESGYGEGATDLESNGRPFGLDVEVEPGEWSRGWTEVLNNGDDEMQLYKYVKGPKNYPFNTQFKATDWEFLKYLFKVEDQGEENGVYTYELTIDKTVTSWEMEWVKRHTTDPLIIQLLGAFVKSATISYSKPSQEEGGFISTRLNCNAKTHNLKDSATETSSFTKDPLRVTTARTIIDGEEIVELNEGEIDIDRNISEEDSRYASAEADRELHDPIPKVHRFTGRHNVNIRNAEWFKKWEKDEPVQGETYFKFEQIENEEEMTIEFKDFWIFRAIGGTNREGVQQVDIEWRGTLDKITVKTKDQWDI